VRDGFSEGFFTRLAHEAHPVDLMCRYLRHGSLDRIPGLLADRETLSFAHLDRKVRAADRAGDESGDAHTFSLTVRRKIRGRLYGLEFRIYFSDGRPWADALIPFGAPVDLPRFLHHFRAHHASGGAPGDWDFEVYTDRRDLRQGTVLFGNRREIWFDVSRGRLATGRLEGTAFGARGPVPAAGGVLFPDRHAEVDAGTAEARALRRRLARLDDPLPLLTGRPSATPSHQFQRR
jgi:hypothetical protein